jgi:hypothetical protein
MAGYALHIEALRISKLLIGSTAMLGASVGLPFAALAFAPVVGSNFIESRRSRR